MDTLATDAQHGPEGGSLDSDFQQLRAAAVTADDNLRAIVYESLGFEGLPMRLDLEVSVPAHAIATEHLERLREMEPHVVILDMSDDPDRAIRAAAAIASGNPRAALVGVGPELQASYLLEAMRAGLVEYLPRPLDGPTLRDALERVMRKRGWANSSDGHRNGKLLSFFSAKGGSGSTSVVTNVGIELHRLTGKKTLLVDLDLELGEISSTLGLRPRFHFVDLVRNFHRMDADLLPSYIESHDSGIQVLSAPAEPEIGEQVTGEQIARIMGFLRSHFDYVLVDTSKSLAPPALAALQASDPIFLVTNMDVPSLRNLKRCLPILDRVTAGDPNRLRLVVNRYNPKSLVGIQDLEDTLGLEVYWTLTNDYATVIQSISTGQPLVIEGSSKYAQQLKDMTRDIVGGTPAKAASSGSLLGRLLSPFRSSASGNGKPKTPQRAEVATHG